jgi:hypothetical protein
MTNVELAKSIRSNLFADRGTDLNEAYNYAMELMMGNPHAMTGMMVVLNTMSNIILENEKEVA